MADMIQAPGLVKRYKEVEALGGPRPRACPRARCWPSSGPTAPARPPRCAAWPPCSCPTRAPRRSPGSTSLADPQGVRRLIGLSGPVRRGRRVPHRLREPRHGRPALRLRQGQGPRAGTRAARALRPRRCRRPAVQDLLRRHAPTPRPRRRPRRRAAGADPRRADHRPRRPQPPADVGRHQGARRATAPPCCSPPSTSRRPTGSPTTSWSSTTAGRSPRAPPTS